jgi:predicted ester cyclase
MTNPLAQGLIRIGETAITKENDAALRAYFAPEYVLHLPAGDINFEQLLGYFAALRAAFPDLAIRRAIIVAEGRYLAARTIFSGTFANVFTQSPAGALQPTGRPVEWELMNIFRYDEQGCLAEEWVQTDSNTFLEKLGGRPPRIGRGCSDGEQTMSSRIHTDNSTA